MTVEQARVPPLELWPDNWVAFDTFSAMTTNWNTGRDGMTGMNYTALESVLRMTAVPVVDWPDVFRDVSVMEQVTLMDMRQKQEQREREAK